MNKILFHGLLAFIISFATAMTATLTQAMQNGVEVHPYALYSAILGALLTSAKDLYSLTSESPRGK